MKNQVVYRPEAEAELTQIWSTAAPEDRSLISQSSAELDDLLRRCDDSVGDPLQGHPAETYAQQHVLDRVPSYQRDIVRVVAVGSLFVLAVAATGDARVTVYATGRHRPVV